MKDNQHLFSFLNKIIKKITKCYLWEPISAKFTPEKKSNLFTSRRIAIMTYNLPGNENTNTQPTMLKHSPIVKDKYIIVMVYITRTKNDSSKGYFHLI